MINTYENVKILIKNKDYDKESMIKKLDIFLNFNRITLEQYIELAQMIG